MNLKVGNKTLPRRSSFRIKQENPFEQSPIEKDNTDY